MSADDFSPSELEWCVGGLVFDVRKSFRFFLVDYLKTLMTKGIDKR